MQTYLFTVYEVDSSYYFTDAQSLVLSKNTLEITDSVDDDLHRTQAEDPQNDQTFDFAGEPAVTDYTVQYLDFAQVNESGPEFELYAMQVSFADGSTKYYVMSKDSGFDPDVGDDLSVTTYSNFTQTDYGQIGAAICYAGGSQILTERGYVPVDILKVGDRVQTKDNGCHEVLWMGKRQLESDVLRRCESLRPVLIRPGAMGNDTPLLVSPQHRLLVNQCHFDATLPWPEGFIKAKHLAEFFGKSARVAHGKRSVTYFHILLDRHEVLFANGIESESLFLGPMALAGISRSDRAEIEALFPDLPDLGRSGVNATADLARPTLGRGLLSILSPKTRRLKQTRFHPTHTNHFAWGATHQTPDRLAG